MLLKLHLYLMKVKWHTINVLAELDITSSYKVINNKYDELTDFKKVL